MSTQGSVLKGLSILFAVMVCGAQSLSAQPLVQLTWENERDQFLRADLLHVPDADIRRCIRDGFEFHVRLSIQLCKYRPVWLDPCQTRSEVEKQLSKDTVTDTYLLTTSRVEDGDFRNEERARFSSETEGIRSLEHFAGISVPQLSEGRDALLSSRRSYLTAQAAFVCSRAGKSGAWRSLLLSLGLQDSGEVLTEWSDFWLNPKSPSPAPLSPAPLSPVP